MASLPIRRDLSAAELRTLARTEDDARVSRRLLALAMALDGISRGEAARHAGMDRQALRDWVVRYNAEGLRDRMRPGRRCWRRNWKRSCVSSSRPAPMKLNGIDITPPRPICTSGSRSIA